MLKLILKKLNAAFWFKIQFSRIILHYHFMQLIVSDFCLPVFSLESFLEIFAVHHFDCVF